MANNIQAKNFTTRQELETAIRTAALKPSAIVGTEEELARFQLSEHTFLHGVLCQATDAPAKPKKQKTPPRPERGQTFPFGINLPVNTKEG